MSVFDWLIDALALVVIVGLFLICRHDALHGSGYYPPWGRNRAR